MGEAVPRGTSAGASAIRCYAVGDRRAFFYRTLCRLDTDDRLPLARAWMWGPRWRRAFDVRRVRIAEIDPVSARYHRPGKTIWYFTFEPEVRERVCEELRPGVTAMWSDAREWLGLEGS